MGDVQKEYLKDIAVQCGATLIDDEYGVKLSEVKLEHFGSAQKIAIDGYTSSIVGGSGDQQLISARIDEIIKYMANEKSPHTKQVHRDRYSRMTAKIAEIQVGGRTETE